jgi:carbon starvation protein
VALGTVFGILLVEGFVITTLDAAVRLNRYLFEELWGILFKKTPRFLKHYWVNSGLSVLIMLILASSNAFNLLWPIFGTANQMLAAMSLLAVSAWLMLRKKRILFTLIPAVFMLITTLASLVILFGQYLRQKSYVLMTADLVLFALAVGVVILVVKTFRRRNREVPARG